jgi:hypothetical protein
VKRPKTDKGKAENSFLNIPPKMLYFRADTRKFRHLLRSTGCHATYCPRFAGTGAPQQPFVPFACGASR